jgi:transcriptional regulator with XRE-family HTH domain
MIDKPRREFSGERLREIRLQSPYSLKQLAREVGIHVNTLMVYQRGVAIPSTNKLPLLADALGCKIDDLFIPVSE